MDPWLSWIVGGLGGSTKRKAVRVNLSRWKPGVVLFQESKLNVESSKMVISWAQSMNCNQVHVPASNSAGGLVILLIDKYLEVVSWLCKANFILLFAKFSNS